jgi:hypothetical protein
VKSPLVQDNGWPLRADQVNALFGFKKVPADFTGTVEFNCRIIVCLKSQPNCKHRMFTRCPMCHDWFTVGCLAQHMKIH